MSAILDMNKLTSNISFASSNLVKQIADPFLKKHGLSYFTHNRNFTDGGVYALTTLPELYEDIYKYDMNSKVNFHNIFRMQDEFVMLWPSVVNENERIVLDFAKETHNVDNGITIIRNHTRHQDCYHFATTPDNMAALNFYVNNLDLLKKFLDSYEAKFAEHIVKCDESRIYIPGATAANLSYKAPTRRTRNPSVLSKQEYQCVKYITAGYSAKQVAKLLELSHRTVESYLLNARKKYKCRNTASLIHLLASDM